MKYLLSLLIILYLLIDISYAQGIATPAPDFTHETLDHGQISLSDHQGKVVYLFFFGWG